MAASMCKTASQAHELGVMLMNAAKKLAKDTRTYGKSAVLKVTVSSGDLHIDIDNSSVPELQAPHVVAKKRKATTVEDTVLCHEAGNKFDRKECVKCTKCELWFRGACVENKFKASLTEVWADSSFECWHCRGVCGLHSCVKKREGGKTAGKVEALVGAGNKYFELVTEAKTAGCDSVRAHLQKIGSEKAW